MHTQRVGSLLCRTCGLRFLPRQGRLSCDCGSPLEQLYNWSDAVRRPLSGDTSHGIWRFRELLPVTDPRSEVTLGEGNTPLLRLERLSERLGVEVLLKDESSNPTGSFKARGAAVAVSRLRELGWRALTVGTSGNGGSAFAAYSARAGLAMKVEIPNLPDIPLTGRLDALAYGARVQRTPLTGNDSEAASVSAFREPYRVEGDKTLFIEVVEQLGWTLPDHFLWPTGGAVALVAAAKALDEMRTLGWINGGDTVNFIAAQHERCAPIASALSSGSEITDRSTPGGLAPGVWVGDVYASHHVLERLRSTTAVHGSTGGDAGIEALMRETALVEGILLCPEGALALSTLPRLLKQGIVNRGQRVVCVNTASGLRYQHLLERWHSLDGSGSEAMTPRPEEVLHVD